MNSHQRERIVDREVKKLQLREAQRRLAEGDRLHDEPRLRARSVLVAVELHDSAAATTAVAAAGVLAAALGAEVILAGVVPVAQPTTDALTYRQVTETARRLPAEIPRRTMLRWGAIGPAIVGAARQEQVDLVVVSLRGDADHYVLNHSGVPVVVVPIEPPADAAA